MKRFIVLLTMCCLSFAAIYADDEVKVVVPTNKSTNYALYPAMTGNFLKLDTRDGTILAVVPLHPNWNRVLNAEPLALGNKPGRFELYPTEDIWVWVLFDSSTGNMWKVNCRAKSNVLTKIPDFAQ